MCEAYRFPHNSSTIIRAILDAGLLRVDTERGEVWLTRIADPLHRKPKRVGCKPNAEGYHRTGITYQGKVYSLFIHKIIWVYANGPIPDDMTVDHKNRNTSDNRLENLQLLTLVDNVRAAAPYRATGDGHHRTRYSDALVQTIREEFARGGITRTQLAAKYQCTRSQVGRYVAGKTRIAA